MSFRLLEIPHIRTFEKPHTTPLNQLPHFACHPKSSRASIDNHNRFLSLGESRGDFLYHILHDFIRRCSSRCFRSYRGDRIHLGGGCWSGKGSGCRFRWRGGMGMRLIEEVSSCPVNVHGELLQVSSSTLPQIPCGAPHPSGSQHTQVDTAQAHPVESCRTPRSKSWVYSEGSR